MRLAFIAPLLIAALPTPAFAQDRSTLLQRLSEADANRDGNITRDEVRQSRAKNFERFDRNRDGVLTLDDIPMFVRNAAIGTEFRSLLTQYDANKDSKVTRDEFVSGPMPMFDMADTNRDSVVTRAELQVAVAQGRAAKGR